MRIGMFTDTYFPQVSGVSTSISILRDQLIAKGHEVYIFTTTDPEAVSENGVIRLPSIPFASFEDRRVAIAGFDRCLKIARNYHLDIVHTHTEFSLGLTGKYVASRLKIPSIHTYHTMYENYTHYIWNGHLIKQSHVRWYSRIFCSQNDGVITPSKLTHDTLEEYGVSAPLRIIPTGVNIPEFDIGIRHRLRHELGIGEDRVVLLSLSRLSKEKSIEEVIEAFPAIQKEIPKAYLVIAGDGPQKEELVRLAQNLAIEDIKFIGQISHSQVNYYYQMANLYINASESESQGLTYLEAIANKLPIVTKENDYLRSIVKSEAFGKLYKANDSLAKIVVDFLNQKNKGKIGEIDQDLLESISAEAFVDNVLEFYETIIQSPKQSQTKFYNRITSAAKELFLRV